MMLNTRILSVLFLINTYTLISQTDLNILFRSEINSVCSALTITMAHDTENRPFLYVANKEAGLKIYDITNINAPILSSTISTSSFLNMEVINLTQKGNYLYLATGNIWNTDSSGMAIVDVTDPLNPNVTDFYFKPNSTHGAGIVQVEGDFAYLGAMQDGLIILNISNKSDIQFISQFISQFIPNINYPVNNPNNVNKFNLRGMQVRNDTIYACYDAGGLRIIDVTNKNIPIEIGHYCNPTMYSPLDHPKAYNNIVIKDSLAYLAVDYCGVEVLNISNPSNITLTDWWNPYGCPTNNWFTSPVHANEIRLDQNCDRLFVSTGKSDLYILDASNPNNIDSIGYYGGVNNSIGSWGVNIFENQIYLSYICVPWPYIPFQSDSTKVKILSYSNCTNTLDEKKISETKVYPNPFIDELFIEKNESESQLLIELKNAEGKLLIQDKIIKSKETISINQLENGLYFLLITHENEQIEVLKMIKK